MHALVTAMSLALASSLAVAQAPARPAPPKSKSAGRPVLPADVDPSDPKMLPPEESPVVVKDINSGKLAERLLDDPDRHDQKVALWAPNEVKELRGVVIEMHQSQAAYARDVQQFARSINFGVYCMLIRWANFEKVLPDQIEKLGKAIGHPEMGNVPWAVIGGSRNAGALCMYTRRDPNRILCVLMNGSPGHNMNFADPNHVRIFGQTPLFAVNGSADPFVNGACNWFKGAYPPVMKNKYPYGGAVTWGGGHGSTDNHVMYWPFVEAVLAVRYPRDASPLAGPVKLKPFTYDKGMLIGPVNWDDPGGEVAAPAAEYKGDIEKATWLPDARTVAVWRAYMVREPAAKVVAAGGEDGRTSLKLDGAPADAKEAKFYDGEVLLGSAAAAPFALTTDKLAKGPHYVYAIVADEAGKQRYCRPITVVHGKFVDQLDGIRDFREAWQPQNVLQLADGQRKTLDTLIARKDANVPGEWKLAFSDDFSGKTLKDAWYEYYRTDTRKKNIMDVVDGEMRLVASPHQAVAMLPYDWPDDLAVEYRCKAMAEKPCDLSCVMFGNSGPGAFPWRGGMMFQFGGRMNEATMIQVLEQPDKNWKPKDCGVHVTPRQWHSVRFERLNNVLKAWIDGKCVAAETLSGDLAAEIAFRRVGLYTFGGEARFDDVKVYVQAPKDPAAVKPPPPSPAELDDLAAGLVKLLGHRHSEQSGVSSNTFQNFIIDLAPSLQRLLDADRIQDARIRERVEQKLKSLPPMPK
jgi:hypothetical protein